MSLQGGIGSLVCTGIRGTAPGDAPFETDLDACVHAGVGAVILFDADVPAGGHPRSRNILDPEQLAKLTAHIRERLGPGVLIAVDQEGGKVARLNPSNGFPATPTAAEFAMLEPEAQAEAAADQARLLSEMGIDLNFAPCVDLALEPDVAIIAGGGRSFGVDPRDVVRAATVVLDAHRAAGVAACLKHFPGHGSARSDTHAGLVDITDTWRRDDELAPYRALSNRPGVAVMAGHLLHRGLDDGRSASLSPAVIDGLLRGESGFDGVVVTDSIDMRAISDRRSPGEATVAAISAGCDLVVDGFNLLPDRRHPAGEMVAALTRALDDGTLSEERVVRSLARLDLLRRQIGRAP